MFKKLLKLFLPSAAAVTQPDGRFYPIPIAGDMNAQRVKSVLESAQGGNLHELLQLYEDMIMTDDHIQGEMGTRKIAVLGDELTIRAKDPKNKQDADAAAMAQTAWELIPNGMSILKNLLDSIAYPVSVVERWYEDAPAGSGLRYVPKLQAVPFHLLDWTEGRLRVQQTKDGMAVGQYLETDRISEQSKLEKWGVAGPDGPDRFIVHRAHLVTAIDQRGGPMRSLVFWWLFKTQTRDWWNNFLARFGAPFLVGKYDSLDERSKSRLQQAFSQATRLFGLVVSKETEIDMLQAMTNSTGEAYSAFLTLADQHISRFFVGQTLSSGSSLAGGLGSGQSNLAGNIRNDLRDYDARQLSSTLRHQLFQPLLDLHGSSGKIVLSFGAEEAASLHDTNETLKSITAAGLEPDDEALGTLGRRFGFGIRRPITVPALPTTLSNSPQNPHQSARQAADAVFSAAASDLAAAFGLHAAVVRQGLRQSTNPQELLTHLSNHLPELPATERANILARAFAEAAAHTL